MKLRDRVYEDLRKIDADIQRTPLAVLIFISCLALLLAAMINFGGLHL